MRNKTVKQKLLSRSLLAGVVAHGGAAGAETFSATNSDAVVTSGGTAESRAVEISDGGSVVDVDVTIEFAKCSNPMVGGACPSQGWTGAQLDDMAFSLESPMGTTVELIPFDSWEPWAGWYGFQGTITLDDEAAQVVNFDPNGPTEGTFQPLNPLSGFDGEDMAGTWTLHFTNLSTSQSPLAYESFTVEIVPEPGVVSSGLGAGASLAGLAARRRRRPA